MTGQADEEQLGFGFEAERARAAEGRELRYIRTQFPDLKPPATAETDSVYTDVMFQRSQGRSCYRAGPNHHLLGGEIVSTYRLRLRSGGAWTSSSSSARPSRKTSA